MEYKQDAVALIVDGGHTIGEVSKKLEISETSIRKWVKKIQPPTEPVPEKPLTETERAELGPAPSGERETGNAARVRKKVSTWVRPAQSATGM